MLKYLRRLHHSLLAHEMPISTKYRVAIHEAGHALMYVRLMPVRNLTISLNHDGGVASAELQKKDMESMQIGEYAWASICISLAGAAAEQHIFNSYTLRACRADRMEAERVVALPGVVEHIQRFLFEKGMFIRDDIGSSLVTEGTLPEQASILRAAAYYTRQEVKRSRKQVRASAKALVRQGYVDYAELKNYFLP